MTDAVAALEAELDCLRIQLAKARHHKKPYAEMTATEATIRMISQRPPVA